MRYILTLALGLMLGAAATTTAEWLEQYNTQLGADNSGYYQQQQNQLLEQQNRILQRQADRPC